MTDFKKNYTQRLIDHLIANCKMTDEFKLIEEEIKKFSNEEYKRLNDQKKENEGKMTFGKYKGKKLIEVAKLDHNYIKWLKTNTQYLNSGLKEILSKIE